MLGKFKSNYMTITVAATVGFITTIVLQLLLLQAKEKEARNEFESQVANLTLFVMDDLNRYVERFAILSKMAHSVNTDDDQQLKIIAQNVFSEKDSEYLFAIPGHLSEQKLYRLGFTLPSKMNRTVEAMLTKLKQQGKLEADSSSVSSVFFEVEGSHHIACLYQDVFVQLSKTKILVACFELKKIIDPLLNRSAYDWLDSYLYTQQSTQKYVLRYVHSQRLNIKVVIPTELEGIEHVFLPRVLKFANQELSMLFTYRNRTKAANKFKYIPVFLGTFLTCVICGYLLLLKRRSIEVNQRVEEKTSALKKLNIELEVEADKKQSLYFQLQSSTEDLKTITNSVNGVIWEADPKSMKYLYISSQVEQILGYKVEDYLSGKLRLGGQRVAEGQADIAQLMCKSFAEPNDVTLEYQGFRNDQQLIWIRNIVTKVFHDDALVKVRGVFFDITEEKRLEEERKSMESQLKHAQKMEAIGQLAAGIAHEINTPSQFVGDNLKFISDAMRDFSEYQNQILILLEMNNGSNVTAKIAQIKTDLDIEFLESEVPQAIEQSIEGVSRVTKIVSAMKDFSHPGTQDKQEIDLNRSIESTTTVASNEWKYIADIEFNLADNLPLVNCFAGEINQVVLNMIVNACHAIEEVTARKEKGKIVISTYLAQDHSVLEIEDNGVGMEKQIIERVFDPFFTTKEVGRGTGQGLSLAYSIIVDKHDGKLTVSSEVGKGSKFTICLPLHESKRKLS